MPNSHIYIINKTTPLISDIASSPSKKIGFFWFILLMSFLYCIAPSLPARAEEGGAGFNIQSTQLAPGNIDQNTEAQIQQQNTLDAFRRYYIFALSFVGIAAFFMITVGGIQYASSFGNPGTMTAAKNKIWAALGGIALAGSSYLILKFINPDLVLFRITNPDIIPPLIIDSSAAGYSPQKAGADNVTFTNTCAKDGGRIITLPREGTKITQRCVSP